MTEDLSALKEAIVAAAIERCSAEKEFDRIHVALYSTFEAGLAAALRTARDKCVVTAERLIAAVDAYLVAGKEDDA